MKFVLSALILLSSFLGAFAQYVNTDELVVVPGIDEPLTLQEYRVLSNLKKTNYESYLSEFMVSWNRLAI